MKSRSGSRQNQAGLEHQPHPVVLEKTIQEDHFARFSSRRPSAEHMLKMLRSDLHSPRVLGLGLGHCSLFVVVYVLAFALRFDFAIPASVMKAFWSGLPWLLGVKLVVFYAFGHFRGWWRYVTFGDLAALGYAAGLSFICVASVDHFTNLYHIPRTILVLDCVLTIIVLGALRASWRLASEQFLPLFGSGKNRWALLVGSDHSTGLLAHQIQGNPNMPYRIRGLLTTNGASGSSQLGRIPILGPLEEVSSIARDFRVSDVLVIAGTIPGKRLRRLMETCNRESLDLKIIPPLQDLFGGNRRIPVREIEINDLLRREPVALDTEAIGHLLRGRRVLVTGAGGSIGSEICRQVLKFSPNDLILVGRGENRIFAIDRELRDFLDAPAKVHPCIADIADQERMRQLFESYRPEVVFHAAAHKHVPLMERNVGEAVKNNIVGTKNLADLANELGVGRFVLISTDKAVRPSSVMGASKRVAEMYVLALSQESSTCLTAVRFGNVLGSNGSVVPLFQQQIRRGGPITITHPEMSRFFMTIPEASQLVLQAAAMGKGGEVFVLDMGEPVKIVDLAHDLVRLSGLPANAIDIVFTGTRPGEKLFEELYSSDEETLETTHPKLRAAYCPLSDTANVRRSMAELNALANGPDELIRAKLEEVVPEYQPFADQTAAAVEKCSKLAEICPCPPTLRQSLL